MKKVFVEGYGCSLNLGATEKIRFVLSKKFELVKEPKSADFILINTCAVKVPTERHMLKRIKQLGVIADEKNSVLVVAGCLSVVSPGKILEAYSHAKLFGIGLSELTEFFGLQINEPEIKIQNMRSNPVVSIIPVSNGCLGECAYCCVKNARGPLKSFSIEQVKNVFLKEVRTASEIWLTSNDMGCYGFDQKENLAMLLSSLLEIAGDYRIRLGMMNPDHVRKFFPELLDSMDDLRVYKFLHLPVQSGSDKVLGLMKRHYLVKEFEELVSQAREKFPKLMLSTDVIAGFPGETDSDFQDTVELIERVKPDVVNVSRFGFRPNTLAEVLPGKIHGRDIKERTRILSKKIAVISVEKNSSFVGRKLRVLVSKIGTKGGFIGRSGSYKPVLIKEAVIGEFVNVRVTEAKQGYLKGVCID